MAGLISMFEERGVYIVPQPGFGLLAAVNREDGVALDATLSQRHSKTSEPTMNPVGLGSPVTDHVIRNPAEFSCDGIFTDTPLRMLANVRRLGAARTAAQATAALAAIVGGVPITLKRSVLAAERSVDLYKRIEEMIDKSIFVTIYTSVKTYRDMQITSIDGGRDSSTGKAVAVSITARRVKVARTRNVPAVLDTSAIMDGGAGVENFGTVASLPPSPVTSGSSSNFITPFF